MSRARITVILSLLLSTVVPGCAQVGDQTTAQSQSPPAVASPSPSSSPSPTSPPPDSIRLEIISAPRPNYPRQAEEKELQGEVWIKLLISETGDVETTEIVSGNPILAKAATEAMIKWKFKPFVKNGRAVKVNAKLPYDFAFQGNVRDKDRSPTPELAGLPISPSTKSAETPDAAVASASAHNGPSLKLRVSQGVTEANIVHRVDPVYPLEAKRDHIQGTVLLEATIGTDGHIHNLKPISGPPVLVEAAMGAVEQWRYRPYQLKGEPVEVETTIKIQFHM